MKILFVRINDKIGDSIIETFFYRELKKIFPQAHITVMCCGNAPVLRQIPYIDDFIFLPPCGLKKFAKAFLTLPLLRKQHFDLLISFTPHWRMKFFNFWISARLKEVFSLPQNEHVSQAYVRVLQRLGSARPDTTYELSLPPDARQFAAQFLRRYQLENVPFLLFNPQGGSARRTLSAKRVQAILKELSPIPVVLCNYQNAYASCAAGAVLWDSGDILQTAALVEKAAYVLTVDTSISHVAEVFDKPMSVLFSLKNYENEAQKDRSLLTIWGPRGNRADKLWAKNSVDEIPVLDIVASVKKGLGKIGLDFFKV